MMVFLLVLLVCLVYVSVELFWNIFLGVIFFEVEYSLERLKFLGVVVVKYVFFLVGVYICVFEKIVQFRRLVQWKKKFDMVDCL